MAGSNVFLSYSRRDRDRAQQLATALEQHGISVWWDRVLLAGQTYDQVIESELQAAQVVVVLWSSEAAASEWVRNEAAFAAERGVLVPVRLDSTALSLQFRRTQAADLTNWNGDPADQGFAELLAAIRAKLSGASPRIPLSDGETTKGIWTRRRLAIAIASLTTIGMAIAAWSSFSRDDSTTSFAGQWRHEFGTVLEIEQHGKSVALKQVNPTRGVTATGTGVVNGRTIEMQFIFTADGSSDHVVLSLSPDGRQITATQVNSDGKDETVTFRR